MLQLRERDEGGDLRPTVRQIPTIDGAARREAVVLVHGFNNHYGEAAAAYWGFRARQYSQAGSVPPALESLLADAFWPGDAAWGLADLIDFMVYPVAVSTARDAAPRLADHLRSMPNLITAHFIGHSLGCRVILETIADFARRGGPTVGKVCLMAAAVPIFKVEAAGDLAGAIGLGRPVLILYSDDDLVLRYAFRPGQTLADGDEGFFPAALGSGRPPPTVVGRLESIDIDGAGHGDYWGHSGTQPAAVASARVGEFFGFSNWPRTIAAREPASGHRPGSAEPREVGD